MGRARVVTPLGTPRCLSGEIGLLRLALGRALDALARGLERSLARCVCVGTCAYMYMCMYMYM